MGQKVLKRGFSLPSLLEASLSFHGFLRGEFVWLDSLFLSTTMLEEAYPCGVGASSTPILGTRMVSSEGPDERISSNLVECFGLRVQAIWNKTRHASVVAGST